MCVCVYVCICICVLMYAHIYRNTPTLSVCVCLYILQICIHAWIYQCAGLALRLCHLNVHSKVMDALVAKCSLSYIMIDSVEIEQGWTT
jgi:hypothetical protein